MGDALREGLTNCVAVLAAEVHGKGSLLAVISDDLREKGVRADAIVRTVAARVGGRGGGKPHMAQAGVEAGHLDEALSAVSEVVSGFLS